MRKVFNELQSHKLWLVVVGLLCCVACAKPIMPALQYCKPIEVHLAKNAYLHWEVGKQYSSEIRSDGYQGAGIIGALVESAMRTNQPSRYQFSYGKAEQSIFMTSLKEVLERNRVFKQVELITERSQVLAKDILINIYFKTCRVLSPERGYGIVLNVDMTISSGSKLLFKRSYLVENSKEGVFVDKQTDVSQILLNKIIAGIEEWHNQSTH